MQAFQSMADKLAGKLKNDISLAFIDYGEKVKRISSYQAQSDQ